MSQAKTTKDHDTIRHWVDERGGRPSTVSATKSHDEAGVLRIDFPGYGGEETLEAISWEDFFEKFDQEGLDFLYQEETDDGHISRFCKFVSSSG